ncbi:diaminobutyrate--2-oxoglutarate transaminase [Agromyces sp. NPDC056523]|uniref:diaminobutyrate--2-oxoglutarate transaminase n=1 Tax=Agromyces sp. NPDC056523 TaxID=3345850 RepID=UPI00366D7CDF
MTTTYATQTSGTAIFERLETECRAYSRDIPAVFATASGTTVTAEDGREYLDFFSGAGALNYGHNDPEMIAAVTGHLASGGILHALDMFTPAKRDLLAAIDETLLQPNGWDYKVQFTGPTGTDANEAALKLARLATGRRGVVAFRGSYHGMSAGSLSVSGSRRLRSAGGALLDGVTFVPYENGPDGPFDTIEYLDRHFADASGGSELPAAVIVEGVQIQAGVYAASAQWLSDLRAWTRAKRIVLILDEVQTGVGRTGPFFSFQHAGIVPDIVTTAKSIGGLGLPLAMVLLAREIDVWQPGDHTGTFRGNQLAFVAGAVALRRWQRPDFLALIEANTEALAGALQTYAAAPAVRATRGLGLIGGIDFGPDDAASATAFQRAALEAGVIVERCGRSGEVVKLMPPITTPTPQLVEGLDRLGAILDGARD